MNFRKKNVTKAMVTAEKFKNEKKELLNLRILCQVTMTSLKSHELAPTKHAENHENKGK